MVATAESWKHTPFGDVRPIPYRDSFSAEEFDRLRKGLVPEVMEHKWFVYYDAPRLHFYRSWTGQPIYGVDLRETKDGCEVAAAVCSAEDFDEASADYEAAVLDFLVSVLLLGKNKPFPLPDGSVDPPGVFQHSVAGTGAPETVFPKQRRPWWRFWR